MQQEQEPRKRTMSPLITQRKLARERVAPYLPNLKRWRNKALQLRALRHSRHHSPEALANADLQLLDLKKEIEMDRQAFLLEMDDIRDMPAVVDYLGALDSLRL